MIWILIGYMCMYMYEPYNIWPFFGTYRIERIYIIIAILAWFGYSEKKWTFNISTLAVTMMAFSIFMSTLLSPYAGLGDNLATDKWFKMLVFYFLMMSTIKTERDLRIICTAFTVCFTIFMLHSYYEYRCGAGVFRMGVWRMVPVGAKGDESDGFGASINFAMPLLLPLLVMARQLPQKKHRLLGNLFIALSFVLSATCIQLTASRTSFVNMLASIFGLALLSKYRFRIFLVLAIAAPLSWSLLPEKTQNRFYSLIDPSYKAANADSTEDRVWGGITRGVHVWLNTDFLFGVGPGGFQHASEIGMQPHSLIGQVTSELGLFGILAYITLIVAVWYNHFRIHCLYYQMKKLGKESDALYLYRISLAVAWVMLLLFVQGLGSHNAFRFHWVWFSAFQAVAVDLVQKKVDDSLMQNRSILPGKRVTT